MNLFSTTIVYTIVIIAVIVGSLMAANASWDCRKTATVQPRQPQSEERLIYRPNGSAEYCTTYSNGTTYCR